MCVCTHSLPQELFEPLEPTMPGKYPAFLVILALLFMKICIDLDGRIDTGYS